MAEKLKLRAEDEEDVQVISACLQDALVAVGDMCFLKDEHRFVLVANRFCWEDVSADSLPEIADADGDEDVSPDEEEDAGYQRVHCGLCFETVTGVKVRGFDPRDSSRILELLALTTEGEDGSAAVRLIFAGDAEILLRTERVECRMEDLDEHWPTAFRPKHPVAPSGQNR
ncbi:MAG: DUF2948 family protein [Gemmatimonas sp.]